MVEDNNSLNTSIPSGLKENLKILMKEAKLTIEKLHADTGVPIQTIKRMRSDDSANPTLSSLIPIADYFSLTINQLIGLDPLPTNLVVGAHLDVRKKWIFVPLLTWESVINYKGEIPEQTKMVSSNANVGDKGFALEITENDISGFRAGTIVILNAALKPKNHDYIVVHKAGSQTASFYEYLLQDDIGYLKPLKQEFRTIQFDNTYKVLGVMVQSRLDRD